MSPKVGIHLFRKDLRVFDNLALNDLSKEVDTVIGIFIFDSSQIKQTSDNAFYYSQRAAQFIVESVDDLKKQCDNKLVVAYGNTLKILETLLKSTNASALSFNADFSSYATKRDNAIVELCKRNDIRTIINSDDQCLMDFNSLLKKDGKPYMVFGSFYKNLSSKPITKPTTKKINWSKPKITYESLDWTPTNNVIIGGRTNGLFKLKNKVVMFDNDHLTNTSSQLSAYLNQGCLSIREVYYSIKNQFGNKSKMLESIAWRDFYLCIYRFAAGGNEYRHIDERYDLIKWPKVKEAEWKRFIKCDTGFLLIDAIMTELLQTGFINNRARLLLGTFWIKYLLISPFDPEYGSQVGFSRLLFDCSASQNKLNHQWVIGDLDFAGRRFGMKGTHSLTGRMIRIDNDMIKKFDPNYEYIAKWLPRFTNVDLKERKKMMKESNTMFVWKDRYMQYAKLFNTLD